MTSWVTIASAELKRQQTCALILVTRTSGSTPREAGARMVVNDTQQWGTIGGGQLEFQAVARARELLRQGLPAAPQADCARLDTVRLGPALGQCCGGTVELLTQTFGPEALPMLDLQQEKHRRGEPHLPVVIVDGSLEPHAAGTGGRNGLPLRRMLVTAASFSDEPATYDDLCEVDRQTVRAAQELLFQQRTTGGPAGPRWLSAPQGCSRWALADPPSGTGINLVLFGAGHVAHALIHTLQPLAWPTTWVDARDGAFPEQVPAHVNAEHTDAPEQLVDEAPTNSYFLVMTHDHQLDYQLCERILRRGDYRYCGLIGSKTKRTKFEQRMRARGLTDSVLSSLVCPIGLPGLGGKAPAEVAIAVAAQLLQLHTQSLREAAT